MILPNYMVPGSFVFLDKLPLTPHGTIDRNALPEPKDAKHSVRAVLPPRDIAEKPREDFRSRPARFAWGRRDDFFDLGGTSLQSVEAMKSIEEIFNVALPPSTLIERCTVVVLAPLLSDHAVIACRTCS